MPCVENSSQGRITDIGYIKCPTFPILFPITCYVHYLSRRWLKFSSSGCSSQTAPKCNSPQGGYSGITGMQWATSMKGTVCEGVSRIPSPPIGDYPYTAAVQRGSQIFFIT